MTAEKPVSLIRLKSRLAHISRGEAAYRSPKVNIAPEGNIAAPRVQYIAAPQVQFFMYNTAQFPHTFLLIKIPYINCS